MKLSPLFTALKTAPLAVLFAERVGCLFGWLSAIALWLFSTLYPAHADTLAPHIELATITTAMLLATIIGTLGSYLAFGEDKKFPPTAASIGHILLGFGAGLFFTRGSLELMGRLDSSENVVLFVSFLWAVVGYFALRLGVAVISSPELQAIMPDWVIRLVGARLPPAQDSVKDSVQASDPVSVQDSVPVNNPVNNPVSDPVADTVKGQDNLLKKTPNTLLVTPQVTPPTATVTPQAIPNATPPVVIPDTGDKS